MKTSLLKQCVLGLTMLATGIIMAAETPVLKITKVQQRYPWNGLVDIDVTVKGLGTPPLYFTATDKATEAKLPVRTLTLDGKSFTNEYSKVTDGTYRFVWNASVDVGEGFVATNVLVRVTNKGLHLYYYVDLSGGSSASSYPVQVVTDFNANWIDEYKTTKLLLRNIPANSSMMQEGSSFAFSIGVFEVTQKQYELVMGSTPSNFKGDNRPVECVGWHDAQDFIAKLNQRTGLSFALPTEVQWEYACRAGTTTSYNNGTESIEGLGRYIDNKSDGLGGYTDAHTTVGSYLPNAWGLYDMHGNVCEWCADLCGYYNSQRPLRGGAWNSGAYYCTSSSRSENAPSFTDTWKGFRVVCTSGL